MGSLTNFAIIFDRWSSSVSCYAYSSVLEMSGMPVNVTGNPSVNEAIYKLITVAVNHENDPSITELYIKQR